MLDPCPGGQNWPTQKLKKVNKFHFSNSWQVFWVSNPFPVAWTSPLYGDLGISKLKFLIKKRIKNIFSCIFSNFWSSKPWIRIHLKCWILIRLNCWIRIQWIRFPTLVYRLLDPDRNSHIFVENTFKNFFVSFDENAQKYIIFDIDISQYNWWWWAPAQRNRNQIRSA